MVHSGLTKKTFFFFENYALLIIILSWVVVQSLLLTLHGIKIDGEALKPILEVKQLINEGSLRANSSFFYLTEIILLYIDIKLGLGFWFVIIIQMILNLISILYFFRFLKRFTGLEVIALLGTLLLILCFPYQQYNTYLYTESIFFSLSIVYSCYLLQIKKIDLRKLVVILILLLSLCLTRPTGIFFIAATIIYLFFFLANSMSAWKRSILFISLFLFAILLLNEMMGSGSGGRINILLPFKEQMIICEVPTNVLGLTNSDIKTDNSLRGLLNYIIHNPGNFLKLGVLKLKAFFGLSRTYYSSFHNGFLMLYFYSLYFLIIITLVKNFRKLPVTYFYLLAVIGIYGLSVVLSCDEWSNRFFLTLTPFIIMGAMYFFVKKPKSQEIG